MCCTTRIGNGKLVGNNGSIAPSAVGPPVETPITTTLGGNFRLCAMGLATAAGTADPYARAGIAASALCPATRKNCLIFGIISSRRRAIERSSEPSFETLAT